MVAAATRILGERSNHCTLLELVQAVTECAESEEEVVATVLHMLQSGRVKLRGTFRDEPTTRFSD